MKQFFTPKERSLVLKVFFTLLLAFVSAILHAQTEIQTAKSYLSQNAAKHKIAQEDIERMAVSSSYLSPTTGWYHVYFNQTYQSIEVYNSLMSLVIKDNQVQYATGSFVPDIAGLVNAGPAALSPVQALQKAAQEANMPISGPAQIKEISSTPLADGSPGKLIFTAESLSDENIVVKKYWLVYEAKEGMKIRTKAALTWNVQFLTKDQQNSWSMHVDAQTGEIVRKVDEVIHCSFGMLHRQGTPHDCTVDHTPVGTNTVLAPTAKMAPDKTYNVFDYPLEAPTFGGRTVVPDPYTKFVPTGTGPAGTNNTNGWHFDGTTDYTITRGNNVWAREDVDGNNNTIGTSPTSATLEFNFPYTQALNTAVGNRDAAITNLFYWNNLLHDVLYKFGFDEPSGNFQNTNIQGQGGAGGDYVRAEAQDGGGINNANFSTPVDGQLPRMQMFLWNFTGGGYQPDGDFDNGIIAHEYGHGWSIRLTGGPANSSCLQNAEQGGEGWSDYLSLMLTTNWASLSPNVASANIPRGIGTYALGQPTTGAGIRPYRYSYDMANINPLVTYGKVGFFDGSAFSQPHGIGSIWATMLWDMTWEIILQDNQIVNNIYDTPALITDMKGNLAALKLVNEGLRMQPCSPSFVQARDAILAADKLLFGGRYSCAIGKAFARRGLGLNASTGTSTNDRIVTEDFTPFPSFLLSSPTITPAICTNTPFSYTATVASGAPTFSWARAAIPGISNAAATANSASISETLINTTSNPITVNYYFTLSPDACNTASAQKVSVVVNPSAVPTVAAYAVCQNTSVPSGEGLAATPVLTNLINGSFTAASPTYNRGVGNGINTYIAAVSGVNTDANAGNNIRYQTFTFVAPTSGTVIFETIAGTLTGNFGTPHDTYITLYQTSFNPANPATNFIQGDDDSGTLVFASKVFHNLTAGTTYVMVVTPYVNTASGTFTIQSSIPVFPGGTNNWYKDPSGGSPLATGELFNPVGVAGSGITNTATAGTTPFYVANALFPDCRTQVSFTVSPIHTITLTSNAATETQTACLNSPITLIAYALGGGATGATVMGLPMGVTSLVIDDELIISGSPTTNVGNPFNYSITTTGNGCTAANEAGTITMIPDHTITLTSLAATETQTLCINTPITPITYSLGGGATGANVSGLPTGVTSTVTAGVLTINGTPTVSGPFNYSVTTTGNNCTAANESGSITVNSPHTITLNSAAPTETQTVCINSPITPITYVLGGGATGATVGGLPTGVTSSIFSGVLFITGSPTTNVGSPFNYNITTTGNTCTPATESGSITVNLVHTITLTSAAPTETQTLCSNSPLTPITYALGGGATGANVTGLPTGVISSVAAGVLTISGTPTSSGPFNYSITTTGNSCTAATEAGSITVNPHHIITLTSAPVTESQIGCINSPITSITYALGGGATGANVSGLPTGVTSSVAAGVLTISGTPTVSGTFNYSITTTGNTCNIANESGTLNLNSKPVITLSVLGQTLNEGNNPVLCDTDANPVNTLTFNVTTACVTGSLVWRTQVGAGAWSAWSPTVPASQPSDNTAYRYQAACDAACSSTYTTPITLTINYRASTPQNVSLTADGTTVAAGESKTICDLAGNTLTFNATCATGEIILYSVDGGDYTSVVPSQIVDNAFHNYRIRCRKADNTPSCVETESAVMSLKISTAPLTPVVSITPADGCGAPVAFTGSSNCGSLTTIWYNATTNQALPTLPTTTPNATSSYYARCRNEAGCEGGISNTVTYTITPINQAPIVTVSAEMVCTGTQVTISANCPAGSTAFWNTGVNTNSFQVAFSNVTQQTYWAKCIFPNGCQSPESTHKTILWKAFELTFINVGQSQSATKAANDRNLWSAQFITRDAGPVLENSTQANPTIFYSENVNKTAPRYWTIQTETCALGTNGSITYNLLAAPEVGVPQSFNTHENNTPYLMYANREGFTELYAQNHPAYGFYQDNGSGGNTYDAGLPKGLYKLGIRYWDQKGQGSIYPSTRQPAGNVLAYQEYWFRIQSQNGIGTGSARIAADNGQRITDNGAFAQVMPNPVANSLHLKISDAKGQKVNVNLMDASGRTMLQRAFVPESNQHQEEFEVSQLSNGMYFLKVNTADKQAILKVIKAN